MGVARVKDVGLETGVADRAAAVATNEADTWLLYEYERDGPVDSLEEAAETLRTAERE
ncbi:hypothetical protein [Natrononativus amylolyticus]|uniref:hypothetical protein n=1 Tax=Natrononativus amylolyticus TaxID=2963434 RepID=UPI0020CCA6FD|nr:hypothetical protein [Natrononativus amylolyticus]